MKTFAYPRSLRITVATIFILGLFGVLVFPFLRGQQLDVDTLLGFSLVLASSVVTYRVLGTTVTLDEQKITYHGAVGSVTMRWVEIDDGYFSPSLIFIASTGQRKQIMFGSGGYGLSLEPYEVLQKEVMDRALPRVLERWKRLQLPREYSYPGLPRSTMVTYALAFGLVFFFFALFLTVEGQLIEKFLFLVIGTLVMVPFLLRDYRRNRKTLILEDKGLLEKNSREVLIPWQAVSKIVVSEVPLSHSSIVVISNAGEKISIPRSLLKHSGEILYLIKAKTNLSEEYARRM